MQLYENHIASTFQTVHETVHEIMEQLKLIEEIDRQFLLFRINFMLREVLNNAVEHGNKFDENKRIYIEIRYEPPLLKFTVEDEGDGINLDHDLDHQMDYILRERSRGIEMIQKFQFNLEVAGAMLLVTLDLDKVREEI